MKRFVLYLFVLVLLTSCKKYKEFDLNYTEEVTIPSNSAIISLPFSVMTPETTTNTQSEYDNEGTSSRLIDQVTLSRLSFSVKSPGSGNFDFLNSIEIYLSSPNQPEILLASKYSIPETGLQQMDMDVSGADLKDYLKESSYSLRVKTVTDKTLSADMTVKTEETFHVKAKLRNLFKK
jgi:hypothetical protein